MYFEHFRWISESNKENILIDSNFFGIFPQLVITEKKHIHKQIYSLFQDIYKWFC